MTDKERLDWLADEMPFDGFAGLDLHDIVAERYVEPWTSARERRAYRWALRELIDRAAGLSAPPPTQRENP